MAMAVTVQCRCCGVERELVFGHPADEAWCGDNCREEFLRVVEHLAAGGDPAEIGLDLESRVLSEALKEVQALRRRGMVERRELREQEFERSRPRKMPSVWERYRGW
jgi:hypothetical protein